MAGFRVKSSIEKYDQDSGTYLPFSNTSRTLVGSASMSEPAREVDPNAGFVLIGVPGVYTFTVQVPAGVTGLVRVEKAGNVIQTLNFVYEFTLTADVVSVFVNVSSRCSVASCFVRAS